MFLGSLFGVIADRLNRKTLIITGDTGQAVVTLLLAFAFVSGRLCPAYYPPFGEGAAKLSTIRNGAGATIVGWICPEDISLYNSAI